MTTSSVTALSDYARARGIHEILHFTTNKGLIGILSEGAVLSRDRVDTEATVQAIRFPNCTTRDKDPEWTGYVNLSVSQVNQRMFGSSRGWHTEDGIWWAVLAFDASILDASGVVFTTTNNSYSSTVRRGAGLGGLEDMFAPRVPWGYYGAVASRGPSTPAHLTTDPQAEVLYPDALPLDALTHIYVPEPDHIDQIEGALLPLFPHVPTVDVQCRPEIFR